MEGNHQLFLIEFLIDRVNIPAVRAIYQEMLPVTTCVSFQVLGLPPINIYEEAPVDGCACVSGDTQVFRKGKSCLFALPNNVLQKPVHSFPVIMSVYKKLPPGVLPDVMLIGSHQIQLKNLVNELLSERIFKNGNPCKSIKSTFRITTATGQSVGEVTVFIRVSCFGKKIVTQFQIPHNKKPYLFKGSENSPVFQCKKIPSEIFLPEPVRCNCPVKKSTDGSGEGKTCCAMSKAPKPARPKPVSDMCKQPDWEPRPCCPSRQPAPSSCSSSHQQKKSCAVPPCGVPPCAAPPCASPPPKPAPSCGIPPPPCPSCCTPQPVQDTTCAPCCGVSSPFDSLFKEKPVRKCGCSVKEAQSCDCRRTSC
ncbi:hypothetical protein KPH14_002366 [Odynerus spinipes]|uniref:Uncharacterized protein n=1 Tax=Odynerus spinipes TaxID=1348599 RepID=A0AAD9RLE0_9HYME|nr:hypothetical protein KPH14_002366 [Odynerus spinipes]